MFPSGQTFLVLTQVSPPEGLLMVLRSGKRARLILRHLRLIAHLEFECHVRGWHRFIILLKNLSGLLVAADFLDALSL